LIENTKRKKNDSTFCYQQHEVRYITLGFPKELQITYNQLLPSTTYNVYTVLTVSYSICCLLY